MKSEFSVGALVEFQKLKTYVSGVMNVMIKITAALVQVKIRTEER